MLVVENTVKYFGINVLGVCNVVMCLAQTQTDIVCKMVGKANENTYLFMIFEKPPVCLLYARLDRILRFNYHVFRMRGFFS